MQAEIMRRRAGVKIKDLSHISVAERDGSSFVKCSLKCKSSFRLFSGESDLLPLDHKHLT